MFSAYFANEPTISVIFLCIFSDSYRRSAACSLDRQHRSFQTDAAACRARHPFRESQAQSLFHTMRCNHMRFNQKVSQQVMRITARNCASGSVARARETAGETSCLRGSRWLRIWSIAEYNCQLIRNGRVVQTDDPALLVVVRHVLLYGVSRFTKRVPVLCVIEFFELLETRIIRLSLLPLLCRANRALA